MTQTPLLLRYKMRDRYDGTEAKLDFNDGDFAEVWIRYEELKLELWQLQLPGSNDFLMASEVKSQYFCRSEYYAAGDPNPVVIVFDWRFKTDDDTIQTYQLPNDDYTIGDFWDDDIRIILQEYERHRNSEWQTRILIEK